MDSITPLETGAYVMVTLADGLIVSHFLPGEDENGEWEEGDDVGRKNGELPFWGNQQTMNINPLILTNVRNSMYYKSTLLDLKTYHEVVDQIYYKVTHLEPWEKGSRKTSGQTGMCGGVRGNIMISLT